jgi:hypothetical protein
VATFSDSKGLSMSGVTEMWVGVALSIVLILLLSFNKTRIFVIINALGFIFILFYITCLVYEGVKNYNTVTIYLWFKQMNLNQFNSSEVIGFTNSFSFLAGVLSMTFLI